MLEFISMLITGLYVITSVLGLKTIALGPVIVASGVLFIAVVKPLLDIINEVYGPRVALATVRRLTVVRMIVFAGMFGVALIPAAHEPKGFAAILTGSVWLFLFGAAAEYLASAVIDIPVFEWLRRHTRSGFLVRQYLSNISLLVQAVVFSTLYTWLKPEVPWVRFFFGQFFALVVISSLLAPLAALVVRRIKR